MVIEEQKRKLCENFSREDVEHALFDIDNTKAPRPDDYTSRIFKEAW